MTDVDVVVVSYNSREHLRDCVEPLVSLPGVHVVVVDNASTDRSLQAVDDLPLEAVALDQNRGFAHGCNVGWRVGNAPFVLFLNPDATIDSASLARLVDALERAPGAGAVAPRIVHGDGTLDYSQRRFPRLRSTYAQAVFLHRLFPHATWTDEVMREPHAYSRPASPDWVSGACLLIDRSVLEELRGLDEGFFMYCEDIDLCRRLRSAGHTLLFEPEATAVHEGGASAPRASMLPILAASRIRYAEKHRGRLFAFLERAGIGLGALTHLLVSKGGRTMRLGHARALRVAVSRPPAES
jgi:N-acetylglucosaminyl-diphospho-decaprenol L-rhamnosyltransferase